MKHTYCLKIDLRNVKNKKSILEIIKKKPTLIDDNQWELELVENENDSYVDFINIFMDILDRNFSSLEKIGIYREDISIWLYYEYDEQCNLEFLPAQMKRIGDNGISLCISCWQPCREGENGLG